MSNRLSNLNYIFSPQEYFLADSKVSIYPVSFSLMASFMSAITLLGVSTEVYQFGIIFSVINISYGFATPIAAYLYLPVFYKLQATSAYEVNTVVNDRISLSYIQYDLYYSIWRNDSDQPPVWSLRWPIRSKWFCIWVWCCMHRHWHWRHWQAYLNQQPFWWSVSGTMSKLKVNTSHKLFNPQVLSALFTQLLAEWKQFSSPMYSNLC